jgi:hypothetical protein
MEMPFQLENSLEVRLCADPAWQEGARWGKPRSGHPEGQVMYHIAEVLANVDRLASSSEERANLRLIALIHDTFKYRVDEEKPKSGENHHAMIARRFAERFLDDQALLDVVELHDEAYNSWQQGARKHHWDKAEERAGRLIARLGDALPLYIQFFRCDNETGSKSSASLEWFEGFVQQRGYQLPARPASPLQQGERPGAESGAPAGNRKKGLWLTARFARSMMAVRSWSIKRIVKR